MEFCKLQLCLVQLCKEIQRFYFREAQLKFSDFKNSKFWIYQITSDGDTLYTKTFLLDKIKNFVVGTSTDAYRRLKTHFYWRFSAPPALEASRNGTFQCISTCGSVMPTACRNLFPENRKSVFKNRKKKILIQGRHICYSPARRAFFRVK